MSVGVLFGLYPRGCSGSTMGIRIWLVPRFTIAPLLLTYRSPEAKIGVGERPMPPLSWPSAQSLLRAIVLALVAFAAWELPAADTAHAAAAMF
jgi:hypothetical protein